MDTSRLIKDLRAEKERIDRAIAALEQLSSDSAGHRTTSTSPNGRGRGRRKMSAAGRKRISEMMKARWAARRKAAKKV